MIVPGEYVSENNVKCVAPESPKAGKVPIQVAFQQGKWSAGNMEFLFYDTPQINKIEPTCGPEDGYTQITVKGRNFVDLGVHQMFCAFNRTILTNATVMEPDIIKCDSPAAHQWFRTEDEQGLFFNVEITIDGQLFGGPAQPFRYYKEG